MVTKIDKFSIIYRPLTVTNSIEVVQQGDGDSDGSPSRQVYDVLGGGYYPDYTVFPLVLQPVVYAYDPDGFLGDDIVEVTKDVANMRWYVIENGVKTLIQNNSTDYEVITDNSDPKKGRLKVKRNVLTEYPITLLYEAEYLDPRTNEIHPIVMTQLVKSEVAQIPCALSLDVPSQLYYNPYRKDGNGQRITHQIVHATVFSGKREVNPTMSRCIWLLSADDGVNWEEFGSSFSNLFAEVSEDSMSIDINMDFMGDEITVRCYALVNDSPSALAELTKESAFAYEQFKITRKLPRYNAGMFNFPHAIAKGQTVINPKAQIDFTNFKTDNPEQELAVTWETRKKAVNQNFRLVGSGLNPTIAVEELTSSVPQEVKLEVRDRGSWGMLTDGSGNPLTDGNGAILMIR